jgi:phenylpropionate dioxygenase-like ring-hydroxylating dioxygenase large terminal subunit
LEVFVIPNQWYVILESNQVKSGQLVGTTRMGEKMVLWRDQRGALTCMSDLCPHRGVALSAGKIIGGCVQCPFHGFEFDTSGRCQLIPANGKNAAVPKVFQVQRVYPTREAHGLIYIWWGEPRDNLPPLPFFDSIDDSFSYATLRDPWATHYSRAIENQLDAVHLPFVHYNTIGRGNRTVVNGPLARLEHTTAGDLLNMWVYNEADTGQTPLRAGELPEPARRPFLQFYFPNLWHNWISDDLRIVAAFVPVDDEHTLMYLRYYQRVVKVPVLRELFNWLGTIGNLVIERQDRRVVVTQRPKRSDLRIGEKMIQGDGPIIEYRRRRRELIEAAGAIK